MSDGELFRIQQIDPSHLNGERVRVLAALRDAVPQADVLEVGSTAVAGVIGKGDIDILVRAAAADFDRVRQAIDALYPRNPVQLSNEVYQGYTVPSELDVAIQLTVAGGPYDDFVRFLDALRGDPSLVERYNVLKRTWDGRPMDAYREAKAAFIQAVLAG